MKFSAQEEIGLRCMVRMACNPARSEKIENIARVESLSPAYVAKTMRILRMSGLIASIRGQKGGYRLTRPPWDTPLSEVMDALGQRFHSMDECREPVAGAGRCVHEEDCPIRPVWSGIDALVRDFLSRLKLSDLVRGEKNTHKKVRAKLKSPLGAVLLMDGGEDA